MVIRFTMSFNAQVFSSTTHRKVRAYLAIQDSTDGFGHGTHVTCTLAGSL